MLEDNFTENVEQIDVGDKAISSIFTTVSDIVQRRFS